MGQARKGGGSSARTPERDERRTRSHSRRTSCLRLMSFKPKMPRLGPSLASPKRRTMAAIRPAMISQKKATLPEELGPDCKSRENQGTSAICRREEQSRHLLVGDQG